MTSRLAFGFRALLVSVVAVACMPGERPPDVPAQRTIAPGADGERSKPPAAFAVVYAGPRGQAPSSAEIAIVWNRALRKLGPADPAEPPPLSITPALRGQWQWVGTRAVTFVPESGLLPGATHFVVKIPAGIRSIEGEVLPERVEFDFETPRPAIVATHPGDGSAGLALDTAFELELEAGAGSPVRVQYAGLAPDRSSRDDLRYRVKTGLRRYLSEARDNYLARLKPFAGFPASAGAGTRNR